MNEIPGPTTPTAVRHVRPLSERPGYLKRMAAAAEEQRGRGDADLRGCGRFFVSLLGDLAMCVLPRAHDGECCRVGLPLDTFPEFAAEIRAGVDEVLRG